MNTKTNKPNWIFDKLRDSKVKTGGLVGDITRHNLGTIEVIVRESIQNAKDRLIKKNNSTLNVSFKIFDLTGKYKENYLNAINWKENLSKHLAGSIKANSNEVKFIEEGLKDINNPRKRLRVFIIEDFGCEGLTGDEFDDNGNFVNLAKADYLTSPTGTRGGSYGVGKVTLMKISSIRALFFSSIPADNKKRNLDKNYQRLFGRIILPAHDVKDIPPYEFDNTGFFGTLSNDQKRAMSFENAKIAKQLLISRPENETGATIAIPGFEGKTRRSLNELSNIINDAVQKFYWPLIENLLPEKIKLNVKITTYENLKIANQNVIEKITDENIFPFIKAFQNANFKEKVHIENSTTKNIVPFEVPKRNLETEDIPKHDKFKTNLDVYLFRGNERLNQQNPLANKCAIIRGFGQIVEYYKPNKVPYNSKLPYFGVLCAGTSKIESFENKNLRNTNLKYEEDFFRNLETQLHDKWTIKSTNFTKNYVEPKNDIVKKMFDDLSQKIFDLCGGFDPSKGKDVSAELSETLSIGKGGRTKPPIEGFRVESENPIQNFDSSNSTWHVELTIKRKEGIEGPINVVLSYSLRSETSEKEFAPIEEINLKYDDNKNLEYKLIKNELHFIMPSNLNTCEFVAEIYPNKLSQIKPDDFDNFDFKKIALFRNLHSINESKI